MKTLSEKISVIKTFCDETACNNCPLFHYKELCCYSELACVVNKDYRQIVERNYEIIQRYKAIESEV